MMEWLFFDGHSDSDREVAILLIKLAYVDKIRLVLMQGPERQHEPVIDFPGSLEQRFGLHRRNASQMVTWHRSLHHLQKYANGLDEASSADIREGLAMTRETFDTELQIGIGDDRDYAHRFIDALTASPNEDDRVLASYLLCPYQATWAQNGLIHDADDQIAEVARWRTLIFGETSEEARSHHVRALVKLIQFVNPVVRAGLEAGDRSIDSAHCFLQLVFSCWDEVERVLRMAQAASETPPDDER